MQARLAQAWLRLKLDLNLVCFLHKTLMFHENIKDTEKNAVTAAIPITRFGGKVLAHSANSIAESKSTLVDEIKFNSSVKKSNRSYRNSVILRQGF